MKLKAIARLVAPILLLAGSATAVQGQQNLILNGTFDTPDLINPPFGFITFNDAPPGFGWTIVSDGRPNPSATTGFLGVDLIDGFWVCRGGTSNPDGRGQCLDIDGRSSISQSFPTIPGQEYLLEFDYSHHFQSASSTGILTVEGATSRISESIVHSDALFGPNTRTDMKWQLFSRAFVADSTSTTLKLQGLAPQGGLGFAVDNFSLVASSGPVRSDPAIEKTLTFGPKRLEEPALVDLEDTAPGQIKVGFDHAQFFGFTIDVSKADSASPDRFVLSDGLARFVTLSGDGESAAEDPSGGMMNSGSCDDGVCDGVKVEADPAGAVCEADIRIPRKENRRLGRELAVGTILVVRLGSESEPFLVGDSCKISVFVETVRTYRRYRSAKFEPNAVLELFNEGGVATNEWFTLNTGVKVYDPTNGDLIAGPLEGLALQPVE